MQAISRSLVPDEGKYALAANLAVMRCIDERVAALEGVILARARREG
jgi:hypothetical protein